MAKKKKPKKGKYYHSTATKLTRSQIGALRRSILRGIKTAVLVARYGITAQAVGYHRAKALA